MKTRWKILIVIGVVFAVAILIPVIRHYQLRFAVESYVTQLKAKGEPMDLAQVIPPPVPPEKNSAPLFWKAVALFTTNNDVMTTNWLTPMHGIAPGKAMVSWKQPEIRYEDWSNSWDELQGALKQNGEAFKLLNQITNGAIFDFHLQYERRFEMTITNLSLEKRVVQKLSASAIYDLHTGNAATAVKKVQIILELVNGTGDERTIISQLVRIAIAQIAAADTWELLQSTNLTDESLIALQDDWSRLDFIDALQRAFPVEREGALTTFTKWRDSNSELQRYFDNVREIMENSDDEDSIWNKTKIKAKIFLWRYWWSYPDELRYLKGYDVLTSTVRNAETDGFYKIALEHQNTALDQLGISKLNDSFDSPFSSQTDFHSMMSEAIKTLANVTQKVKRVEVAKQATIITIALKRYQLKHGNYPLDLNLLVPDFVPAVPLDPVDGQPLRYRRNADGSFLLYSVGENGVDDGGDPSLEPGVTSSSYYSWQRPHALDWVWPQPATAAEIQKYYEEQARKSK